MNLINENKLKHYVKELVKEELDKLYNDNKKMWKRLAKLYEEIDIIKHKGANK